MAQCVVIVEFIPHPISLRKWPLLLPPHIQNQYQSKTHGPVPQALINIYEYGNMAMMGYTN